MKATRISKKLLNQLPTNVSEYLQWVKEDYGIKSVDIRNEPAGYSYYNSEGHTYRAFYGKIEAGYEMVSEANVGASGLSNKISDKSPAFPSGTWIVDIGYYGNYYCNLINVGNPALE